MTSAPEGSADSGDRTAADGPGARPGRRRASRRRRVLSRIALGIGGLLVAGVIGLVVWSQVGVMGAEPGPLAALTADPGITIDDSSGNVVMTPTETASGTGLVFIPGAKVDAEAYAAKLADLVTDEGVTVVITRPWLNLAFFDLRPLSSFTDAAPGVSTWLVGGHSLGGVKACQLAPDADGLVLFASYCANDLSGSGLPAVSLGGSEDGLSTPAKIDDARPRLPSDATLVQIDGAAHSSFGDYGPQDGDGTPSISDEEMTAAITASVADLLQRLER